MWTISILTYKVSGGANLHIQQAFDKEMLLLLS